MYWYYLDKQKFLVRQYSILPFVDKYSTIVEIGCGKNPISNFLINKNFILIEPYYDIPKNENNNIIQIKKEINDINIRDLNLDKFCLVVFGIDWDLDDNTLKLFNMADLSIIETTTDLEKHRKIIDNIKNYKKPWIEYDLSIFDDEKYPEDSWPTRCNRKIMIFVK